MIVVTICARDEEEIIGACIEHHLASGADRIILTDNASVDNTRKIAESYPEVEIVDQPTHDYRHGEWVTAMVRMAYKMGADWVVNIDADEFWYGITNVYRYHQSVSVIHLPPNYDYLPLRNAKPGLFRQENMPFWTRSPISLRLVHRAMPDVIVSDGNHKVFWCPGEAVEVDSDKMIWMKHYSIRSYEQFERKVINGGTALQLSPQSLGQSTHWRHWYTMYLSGALREVYDNLSLTYEMAFEYLQSGKIWASILL